MNEEVEFPALGTVLMFAIVILTVNLNYVFKSTHYRNIFRMYENLRGLAPGARRKQITTGRYVRR